MLNWKRRVSFTVYVRFSLLQRLGRDSFLVGQNKGFFAYGSIEILSLAFVIGNCFLAVKGKLGHKHLRLEKTLRGKTNDQGGRLQP